ncbi:MAG: HDOD domain-containing protein [Methylococcales bacterium]|nr:HDOD domain-containing protein [Methylococcales bacterium]
MPTPTSRARNLSFTRLPDAVLKQFPPIRELDSESLRLLNYQVEEAPPHIELFQLDQICDGVYYLLSGKVTLQAEDTPPYTIEADDLRAHLPLNSGPVFTTTATTEAPSRILIVEPELLQIWNKQCRVRMAEADTEILEVPEQLGNDFLESFAQSYRDKKLVLPSLPTVAVKLKQAMQSDDVDIATAVEIIQVDPAIAAKLIQVANSPLYAPINPITNCMEAVTRLGLNATRNLVLGLGLKQMFHSQQPMLMQKMNKLWQDSVYLSTLAFVLAEHSQQINPDDALLAGLVADIGIIPIIHYAEQHPNLDDHALQQLTETLGGAVGMLVLKTLGFSADLQVVPEMIDNWFHEQDASLQLMDILLLARLHQKLGQAGLPMIHTIPAFAKLKDQRLTPEFSLFLIQQSQHRIQAALKTLI